MMSADHDDRVDPMHARKFVAAVQATGAADGSGAAAHRGARRPRGADQVAKAIEPSADMYRVSLPDVAGG